MFRNSVLARLNKSFISNLYKTPQWVRCKYTNQTQTTQVTAQTTKQPAVTNSATKPENLLTEEKPNQNLSFATMFKQSKFVALGDLENKFLIGKIVDVLGDDLYIDYGGKFNCVVKRPQRNPHLYVRNTNVKIKLRSFEMASYFLNAAKHLTLLESDADLIGLVHNENKDDDERFELKKKEISEFNSEPYY